MESSAFPPSSQLRQVGLLLLLLSLSLLSGLHALLYSPPSSGRGRIRFPRGPVSRLCASKVPSPADRPRCEAALGEANEKAVAIKCVNEAVGLEGCVEGCRDDEGGDGGAQGCMKRECEERSKAFSECQALVFDSYISSGGFSGV